MRKQTWKATVSAAAIVATAIIPMAVNADTIEINGVTWTYTVNDATAKTVTLGGGTAGSGGSTSNYAVASDIALTPDDIPWTFTIGDDTYTVTKISSYAFKDHVKLTGTLAIPDSVTTIGERAFESCAGITGLSGCNGVTRYYAYVFNNNSNMAGNYPDLSKVTSFGNGTFQFCNILTGHVTLCPTLTSIPSRLFYRNSITSIDIPPSVTSIGSENVFRESKKLKSICVLGAATGTTINPTSLFQSSSVLKTVFFGPTTKCSSGKLETGSMLSSVSGCTVIVPRSGWDGLVTGGSSNTIVYYGPNDDFDLSLDASEKVITAVPNNGDGLVAALNFADTFKTEFGYDTKITVTNAIDLTGVTITEAMVADVTFNRLWFAVKTQAQLNGILDAFPAATEMAIDPTGLTENLTVPAGRKIFVQAGGTYEIKKLKNGFVLIMK